MTSRRTWQKWEQKVAEDLGGKRMYASGSFDAEGGQPDVEFNKDTVWKTADFYVETKYRKVLPLHSDIADAFDEALLNAEVGQLPAIVCKERRRGNTNRMCVIMPYNAWLRLAWAARKGGLE